MKNTSIIGFLFFLCVLSVHSQEVTSKSSPEQASLLKPSVPVASIGSKFSRKNLELASIEDLNLYLRKAQKQKKTGVIMSIAGPLGCLGGIAIAAAAYGGGTEGEFAAGGLIFFGGLVTTAVGLPILITGSVRKSKVEKAINAYVRLSLDSTPGTLFNNITQNLYPNLTLRVIF